MNLFKTTEEQRITYLVSEKKRLEKQLQAATRARLEARQRGLDLQKEYEEVVNTLKDEYNYIR